MMRTTLHKTFASAILAALLWFAAGCDQAGQPPTAPAVSSGASLPELQKNRLDPDSSTDAFHYADLIKELRPLTKPGRPYRLGVVLKYSGNPYYQRLADGMHTKATELGLSIYVQAGITESDQEGQRAVLEQSINNGYDAILISPQTDTNLLPAVKIAREKGILLINVDDALLREADYYIGPNHYESGVMAANYFIDSIGAEGKVAVIKGHNTDHGVERQIQGFEDTLKGTSLHIISRPNCVWDLQIALQSALAILAKNPDLKGFYCNNDTMALGAAQAVKKTGKTGQVLVVGRDGIEEAYEAIRKEEMAATVDTEAFDLGRIAVELTVRILEGQDIRRVVFTQQKLTTKENVAPANGGQLNKR